MITDLIADLAVFSIYGIIKENIFLYIEVKICRSQWMISKS